MLKEELLSKTIRVLNLNEKLVLTTDLENKDLFKCRLNPGFTVSPHEITIDTSPEEETSSGVINLQVYKTKTVAQYSELVTEMMKESNLIVESFLYSLDEKLTITSGRDEEPPPENIIPLTNNTTLICILKGIHKIQIVLYSSIFLQKTKHMLFATPAPKKDFFLANV